MPGSSAHDPVANAETTLQQQIRLALGTRPDARIFRNQVGSLPDPRSGRLVTFGLAKGSADLIGWRTIIVTPAMVGTRLAIFTSIEVKTPTGRIRPEQQAWLATVQGAGGIAGVARSVTDAQHMLTNLPTYPVNSDSPLGPMDDNPPTNRRTAQPS
jgi:hypothetical protein